MSLALLMHHHQIARQNTGVQHGLAADTEGKILSIAAIGIEGKIVLDTLLCQNGRTGGNSAHDGHATGGNLRLFVNRGTLHRRSSGHITCLSQRQGAGLAILGQEPFLLHVLQMEVHRGRGAQTHTVADLADGGGIAVLGNIFSNVIVDLLLLSRHLGGLIHFCHMGASCQEFYTASITHLFEQCNTCSKNNFSNFSLAFRTVLWYD